jgi:uncharacterized protein YhbP (UPF0306 family)
LTKFGNNFRFLFVYFRFAIGIVSYNLTRYSVLLKQKNLEGTILMKTAVIYAGIQANGKLSSLSRDSSEYAMNTPKETL